jgi:hypothetical protein
VANPVKFDYPPGFKGSTGAHTSVLSGGFTFTSVEFFLRKPSNWAWVGPRRVALSKARQRLWYWRQRLPGYVPAAIRRPLKRVYTRVTGRSQ